MKTAPTMLAIGLLIATLAAPVLTRAQNVPAPGPNASLPPKLVGKWTQHTAGIKEGATLTIVSVDPATGLLKGKWVPPTGPAAGKEFDVVGWASWAPPVSPDFDNVVVVSFSVSLTTYGSLTGFTGFLRDGQIITVWHNIRPNSRYVWDHVVANQDIFTRTP